MIELGSIVYDRRARDGTWCRLPYPGHPRGCNKFPRCPALYRDFLEMEGECIRWFAVLEEFDLSAQARKMKDAHPDWTYRQCKNLLYWQGGVMASLEEKAMMEIHKFPAGGIFLRIPEACGVNVFETMAAVGVTIDRHPQIVRKVVLIGRYPKEK